MGIIFAILIFSFLIFIHELGHFLAAKASRVQVNEFSMFMGPAIFKKKKGDTLYSIRCIPIGGYCAMEGEDADTDNPHSFQKAAWWKRLIILAAGSFMNFLAGYLMFAIFLSCAYPTYSTPQIDRFESCSTVCGESLLQEGDVLLQIDGENIYVLNDFNLILTVNSDQATHHVVVQRDGKRVDLGEISLNPHKHTDKDGNESSHYGIYFKSEEKNLWSTLRFTWLNTIDTVRSVRLSLQMLVTGKAGFSDVAGPVGIVSQMNEVANASATWVDALLNLLYFGAFIAINLAVMNMLPIPALDGGRIFALIITLIIEKITRKKLNPKYEGYIHGVGMVLLLALMAVILFKDVFTIFKG